VRPEVVVEVTYLTWTADNLLRLVSYQGQREDKPAGQAVDLFLTRLHLHRSIPISQESEAGRNQSGGQPTATLATDQWMGLEPVVYMDPVAGR
jgi:hypothetical protein